MSTRKNDIVKENRTPGRPPIGKAFLLRLGDDIEGAIISWIAEQPEPRPRKPEAIRQLLSRALRLRPR